MIRRCIEHLATFMQPILDGVFAAMGWPCTLIAGGPEPADAGQLNILRFVLDILANCIPVMH